MEYYRDLIVLKHAIIMCHTIVIFKTDRHSGLCHKQSNKGLYLLMSVGTSEYMWVASPQEISQLKQGLVSIFNDSFSRKLIDTKQVHKYHLHYSEIQL